MAVANTTLPPPLPARLPPVAPIDLRLMAQVPSLSWRARYLMDGFLNGLHRSPSKGSSVEFAEYRAYQPGDDLRRIDWRLYGRTDRLHLKQYEEDTQVRAHLVLDVSASMSYAGRAGLLTKLDYARTILAALAFLMQRENDATGLAIIGSDLEDFAKARCSKAHVLNLIGKLDRVPRGSTTQLGANLVALARLLPRRSLVIVASDFYEEEEALVAAVRRLRHDRHEVVGFQVLDPVEVDFDAASSGTFVDLESGERLRLNSEAVRAGYLKRFGAFLTRTEEI
ncbi:MAG: DUF58 domain-containing protein, partial [Verrucomicrobiota bacterium]|nr:DUF58 domain-containing protein [Verrucomicrobiota bacterium]